MKTSLRCGDVVEHEGTGELWVVAWAEGDYLAWCGWPPGQAKIRDCRLRRRVSDAEHRTWVAEVIRSGGPLAEKVRRLYGDDKPD